jgi:hypothetical protein
MCAISARVDEGYGRHDYQCAQGGLGQVREHAGERGENKRHHGRAHDRRELRPRSGIRLDDALR